MCCCIHVHEIFSEYLVHVQQTHKVFKCPRHNQVFFSVIIKYKLVCIRNRLVHLFLLKTYTCTYRYMYISLQENTLGIGIKCLVIKGKYRS